MVLSDVHKFPFSLFIEAKSHPDSCKVERAGNVTDTMDKGIGRSVIKIKGAVSANNYVDFSNLSLEGNFVCIQLCMMKSNIATMHMELETSQGIPLRVTISTLYDTPRFLGRSLRLPLPLKPGWTNMLLDMNDMLRQHCPACAGTASTGQFKFIRRIQLCSNMIVRDIVTSNRSFSAGELPCKEIAVLAAAAPKMGWLDLSQEGYFHAPSKLSVSDVADRPTPLRADLENASPATTNTQSVGDDTMLDSLTTSSRYQHHHHSHPHGSAEQGQTDRSSTSTASTAASQSTASAQGYGKTKGRVSPSRVQLDHTQSRSPASGRALQASSPSAPLGRKSASYPASSKQPVTPVSRQRLIEADTPDLVYMEQVAPHTVADDGKDSAIEHSRYKEKKVVEPSRSRIAIAKVTPRRVTGAFGGTGMSSKSATTVHSRKIIPATIAATPPSERVLGLERCMDYRGGPAALLYNGDMIALASGCIIVLLDVRAKDVSNPSSRDTSLQERGNIKKKERYATGLWKAFKPSVVNAAYQAENYPQAYLKGHTSDIIIIEISLDGRLMATCESGEKARLFLWDLQEGKRLAVLQPHAESVHSLCFSPESTMLCTTGWDHVRRVQIVVWDIPSLVQASSGTTSAKSASASSNSSLVISRQLSDFHISKIMFSPFQEDGLVSCGRENIRFWRMRKGHLPGRPVQLNEFSRGYLFTDLTYVNAPELGTEGTSGALSPCVLVASSLGLLLRVDCAQEQVVCAYQLHNGPIRSLCVNGSYAVTGGDDCRMRIWPLHFTDFLMEAHHEAAVTHVFVSPDMRLLSVGTASGTLGILDVMDHRYWTVLRSHVGSVVSVATRPPLGEEFLSVGKDNTIRLWDASTGQQKFEFDSPQDTPLCGAYHPVEHVLAVGFSSGAVRIFDVQTTSTRFERTQRNPTPISCILYSQAKDFTTATQLRLYVLSLSGQLSVYDVGDNYTPVRSISLPPNPWEGVIARDIQSIRYQTMMQMAISRDGRLLATSCGSINSLCVFDTDEMVTVYKGSTLQGRSAPGGSTATTTDYSAPSIHHAMASSLRSHGSHAMTASSTVGNSAESAPVLGKATSPIAGLVFCQETDRVAIADSNTLLIVTDARVISMDIALQSQQMPSAPAVLESQYAATLSQDDISSRRLEGNVLPVAGSISRDHATGLLFMAVRCAGVDDKAVNMVDMTTPYSKYIRPVTGDALAVVGCSVKRTRDPQTYHSCSRLQLTSMQLFTDIPGDKAILSTAPCGPSCNRVVMADQSGGVSIYHMRDDRIGKLKERESPQHTPSSQEDSLLDGEDGEEFNFGPDQIDVEPPSPPDRFASTDDDRMERNLGSDFAGLEVSSQKQSRRSSHVVHSTTTASMNALYDDTSSPDQASIKPDSMTPGATNVKETLRRVTAAWEEESEGPIGTPPQDTKSHTDSVHWKDAESAPVSNAHLHISEHKQLSKSTTTTTTITTSKVATSSSATSKALYARSVPMAIGGSNTKKRTAATTTAVNLAAARSTASSRNQKNSKRDPGAMIRRRGPSYDDLSSFSGEKGTVQSSLPISPVAAAANYSHELDASFGSDTILVKEQMAKAHYSSHDLHEGYESDGESVDSDNDRGALSHVRTVMKNGVSSEECAFRGPLAPARVLAQNIKVTPSFCASVGSLLTCGGTELCVESVGTRSNYAILSIPPFDCGATKDPVGSVTAADLKRVVHLASLSPSGLFAAAITDVVCHDMRNVATLPPSELHVWTCEAPPGNPTSDIGQTSEGMGDMWRHIGTVALHRHAIAPVEAEEHTFAASAGASLDWAHDDSLALLVPVPIPSAKPHDPLNDSTDMFDTNKQEGGALLSITKWSTDEYEEPPSFDAAWDNRPGRVPQIDMPGIPLMLPFTCGPDGLLMLKEWYGQGDCGCVVWGKGKIAVYAIHAPVPGGGVSPTSPMWISDAGRSGPYLSVQVSQYSHLHTARAESGPSGGRHSHCHHTSNAIATHDGHSFQELCVRPNHIANVDAPSHLRKKRGSKDRKNTFKYDSVGLTSDCSTCDAEGLFSCACRVDTQYHTFPLLVALDSLGCITCVRLTTHPEPPMKCTAKVSASHVSGAPRTLALSPCGTVLVMGSSSSLQIFHVAVKDSPGSHFSVALTLLQKVVVPFPLDFMSFSVAPHSGRQSIAAGITMGSSTSGCKDKALPAMEVVLASALGDVGVYRSSSRKQKQHSTDKKSRTGHVDTYRSPVAFTHVNAIAVSAAKQVCRNGTACPPKLFTLDSSTAQLGVMDANLGVKMHSGLDARHLHSCVCIDTYGDLMAVGSKCGRVSIYMSSSMALLYVQALSSPSHYHHHSNVRTGERQYHAGQGKQSAGHHYGSKESNQSIKAVKFLENGSFLLVLRDDNAVFVLPTKGAIKADGTVNASVFSHQPRPVPFYLKASTTDYAIFPVYGDECLFSVVRRHTVFLYAIERRDDGMFHSVRIGSMKLAASCFFDSDLFTSTEAGKMTSRAFVAAATQAYPVRVKALHIIKEDHPKTNASPRLRISVVGGLAQMGFNSALGFLFAGSVEMSEVCSAVEKCRHHEVNLFTCASLGVLGHSFSQTRPLFGVTCGDAVCVFDIDRLHSSLCTVRANALTIAEEEYAAADHDDILDDVNWRKAVGTKGSIVREVFNNKDVVVNCCRGMFPLNTDRYRADGAAAVHARITLQRRQSANDDVQSLFVCTSALPAPSVYHVLI